MIKNEKAKKVLKALDVLLDSITFISIQYILLCCMYAFRANIVYVFFFALNISIISKHWTNLKDAIPNKMLFIIVFAFNFIVLAVFMLLFGYLEILPMLKEVL